MNVSFVSKVRPRTFGCVAMRSAVLFIFRSRLLLYSAGSGVNSCFVWARVRRETGKYLFRAANVWWRCS